MYTQSRVIFERQNAKNSYLNDTHMIPYHQIFEKMLENKKLFPTEQRQAMNQGNIQFMSLTLLCPKREGFAGKCQVEMLD